VFERPTLEPELHFRSILADLALTLALTGCAHKPMQMAGVSAAPTLQGDPAHPDVTKGWVDTRLYFGLGPFDEPGKGMGVSEAEWRLFLDREVTPRFSSGLSVLDVYGQWQGKNQASPERLRTKCLVLDKNEAADAADATACADEESRGWAGG